MTSDYRSPLGKILLAADSRGLTGLWFDGQQHYGSTLPFTETGENNNAEAALAASAHWLDLYFSGSIPDFTPPVHLIGTPFQVKVWSLLPCIPYGESTTYGALALKLQSSARAVGTAVGRNPVSVILPCHRVLGSSGKLTGYAGGLERKSALLLLESRNRI